MGVAGMESMRPSIKMLGLGCFSNPISATNGQAQDSKLHHRPGLGLQLKPISVAIMGKPKTPIPITTRFFTWASSSSSATFLAAAFNLSLHSPFF